jgi:hypothetical protein
MLLVGMGQGTLIQVALLAGQNAVPYKNIETARFEEPSQLSNRSLISFQ